MERTAKAAALATLLQTVFRGSDEVRVTCPVKMGEIRLIGLNDSVTRGEVAAATSPVRAPPRGLGKVWVRCPLTAANKVVDAGRLRVGWFSARVEALAARPLQCYRCLETGHVWQPCPCGVDRSDRCFNCGDLDH